LLRLSVYPALSELYLPKAKSDSGIAGSAERRVTLSDAIDDVEIRA
jgi:hypothetical protein